VSGNWVFGVRVETIGTPCSAVPARLERFYSDPTPFHIVIPGGVRGAQRGARRPGTYSDASQILKWVPDRAPVPRGKTCAGASGMTNLFYFASWQRLACHAVVVCIQPWPIRRLTALGRGQPHRANGVAVPRCISVVHPRGGRRWCCQVRSDSKADQKSKRNARLSVHVPRRSGAPRCCAFSA
jgi:hypothetical protein